MEPWCISAVPAFHGDPQFGVGRCAFRDGQGSAHAVRCAKEDHPGRAQAAWLADAQVALTWSAQVSHRAALKNFIGPAGSGAWALIAELGEGQAPGANLYFSGHPLALIPASPRNSAASAKSGMKPRGTQQ